MADMIRCDRCKKKRPSEFVQPMMTSKGSWAVDPECALEILGEVHGVPFTEFTGTQAQVLLEDFRDWKVAHPEKLAKGLGRRG